MAVLVTGGAGYIGSHMILALLEAGERVVALDICRPDLPGRPAARPAGDRRFRRQRAGLGFLERHEVTAIAHFAAKIVVPEFLSRSRSPITTTTPRRRAP